ncbi:MAG: hypothetical protein KA150_00005, partial [Propionivibrio sp.]|nr:hypothetical protein [Propionivibrio sp.]
AVVSSIKPPFAPHPHPIPSNRKRRFRDLPLEGEGWGGDGIALRAMGAARGFVIGTPIMFGFRNDRAAGNAHQILENAGAGQRLRRD